MARREIGDLGDGNGESTRHQQEVFVRQPTPTVARARVGDDHAAAPTDLGRAGTMAPKFPSVGHGGQRTTTSASPVPASRQTTSGRTRICRKVATRTSDTLVGTMAPTSQSSRRCLGNPLSAFHANDPRRRFTSLSRMGSSSPEAFAHECPSFSGMPASRASTTSAPNLDEGLLPA